MFNPAISIKLQSYMNKQDIDQDLLNSLDNTTFRQMYTDDEYDIIRAQVSTYNMLKQELLNNPSPEVSSKLEEVSNDLMCSTGVEPSSFKLSDIKTFAMLDEAMANTNLRSNNDLYVTINYDDYSNSSNYVKCELVGHDYPFPYGISANARFIITPSGTIITTKNALYSK